jgi:hypothetical protein
MKTPRRESPEDALATRLQKSASIYLEHAVKTYVQIEGKLSLYSDESIGQSAAIVASVHRCMEHLLKLAVLRKDPLSLFLLPKTYEKYAEMRGLSFKKTAMSAIPQSGTIKFLEAMDRVDILYGEKKYDSQVFRSIHTIRNSIEHCWDHNLSFLEKNISIMTSKILPAIAGFLSNILGQKFEECVNHWLLEDVKKLDLAIAEGHSLALQKRLDAFKEAFSINVRRARALSNPPSKPLRLDNIEIVTACPVCKTRLTAYWDLEADFDENGPIGAYPDAKLILCSNCGFYVEGMDIDIYLPDGLDEYLEDYDWRTDYME